MVTYAILGATGSTGSAVIRHLNNNPPADLTLNICVRSKSKILTQQPNISEKKNYTILESPLSDTKAIQKCLQGADVILVCTGTNDATPGNSIAQDSAKVIISALKALRATRNRDSSAAPWKATTAILLSSASLNKKFNERQPWIARSLLHFALYWVYHDLELAYVLYKEAASDCLLNFVPVEPGGLMDPDGTVESGHILSTEDCGQMISYSDLGAGFCELAVRREEFSGLGVSINATGDVKATWSLQLRCLAYGLKGRLWG